MVDRPRGPAEWMLGALSQRGPDRPLWYHWTVVTPSWQVLYHSHDKPAPILHHVVETMGCSGNCHRFRADYAGRHGRHLVWRYIIVLKEPMRFLIPASICHQVTNLLCFPHNTQSLLQEVNLNLRLYWAQIPAQFLTKATSCPEACSVGCSWLEEKNVKMHKKCSCLFIHLPKQTIPSKLQATRRSTVFLTPVTACFTFSHLW